MHSQEILKLRAEFASDDNGSIWFLYASQIYKREMPVKDKPKMQAGLVKAINQEVQLALRQ